jgi:glyoxylase-like metal-dependent hydrolase (beta-lactamase superfamily II)
MPMNWDVFALRYAEYDRRAQECFIMPVTDPHESMPMDYYVWAIRAPDGRTIVVDAGFDEASGTRRGRKLLRSVADCLLGAGIDPATVDEVVITHLHYDHAGNLDIFPKAVFHLQEREMAFATGKHMCSHCIRHPFEVDHVVAMVRALYADRVRFHDGDAEIAPGVTLHRVGGHSDGLQMVRVQTQRGPVVLASDASHYFANMERENPFPIVFDLGAMVQGWRRARALAGGDESLIVPGHDPLLRKMYPALPGSDGEVLILHEKPVG